MKSQDSYAPDPTEGVPNLGREGEEREPLPKSKKSFYKQKTTEDITDPSNFQPLSRQPDEELIEKEENEIREQIAQLKRQIANLDPQDLIRKMKEEKIKELRAEIGQSEKEEILEEIARLKDEIYPLDLKDQMRIAKEIKIEKLMQKLNIPKDSEEPGQIAA